MEREWRLYKLSKTGKLQEFVVIARSVLDGAIVKTLKGYIDGAYQEDVESILPKNVGRANETTPYQQALLQAESKVNKLKDKGYKELDPNIGIKRMMESLSQEHGTDANGERLPMLAQKDLDKIKFPGYVQRKYDGVRGIGPNTQLRSRKGKPFIHLSHLTDVLPKLPPGWEFDGELYHHERSLQQILSMVKREQPSNKEIMYRVYDLAIPNMPYNRRRKVLEELHFRGNVELVPTYRVNSMDELMALFYQFREEGYEGAIWRSPQGLYEFGTRSWNLIKIKDFMEEEFEIIGANEATGRDAGTAIFVLKTKAGIEFDCRPMGSRAQRAEYLDNIDNLIGEMATVRFQNWTPDGKPFHARVVNIRDYEIQGG